MKCNLSIAIRYQVSYGCCFLFKTISYLFVGAQPPSLLITVSGNVTHGLGPSGNPPDTPPRSIEGHPRVFSQTFILVPDPTAPLTKPGEVAKYYVGADALRFVGWIICKFHIFDILWKKWTADYPLTEDNSKNCSIHPAFRVRLVGAT